MSDDSTTQVFVVPRNFRKPVVAQFDQREGSSDGGTLLLKAADRYYGLVAGLASCLRRIPLQGRQVPLRRRVIIKVEVFRASDKEPEDNPRFVITQRKLLSAALQSTPGPPQTPQRLPKPPDEKMVFAEAKTI